MAFMTKRWAVGNISPTTEDTLFHDFTMHAKTPIRPYNLVILGIGSCQLLKSLISYINSELVNKSLTSWTNCYTDRHL